MIETLLTGALAFAAGFYLSHRLERIENSISDNSFNLSQHGSWIENAAPAVAMTNQMIARASAGMPIVAAPPGDCGDPNCTNCGEEPTSVMGLEQSGNYL